MTLLETKLNEFTTQFPGYRVIYVSVVGSRLYGTNSEGSDTDYKGIFIPTKESLLLKTDCEHFTFTTGAIKFPLDNRKHLKEIKAGLHPLEDVLNFVASSIDEVDRLLEVSTLPKTPHHKEITKLLLVLLSE